MQQKTSRLYPSAPLESENHRLSGGPSNIDLEEIRKKLNDVNSCDNSIDNIKNVYILER